MEYHLMKKAYRDISFDVVGTNKVDNIHFDKKELASEALFQLYRKIAHIIANTHICYDQKIYSASKGSWKKYTENINSDCFNNFELNVKFQTSKKSWF